jgi:hypothetical protein
MNIDRKDIVEVGEAVALTCTYDAATDLCCATYSSGRMQRKKKVNGGCLYLDVWPVISLKFRQVPAVKFRISSSIIPPSSFGLLAVTFQWRQKLLKSLLYQVSYYKARCRMAVAQLFSCRFVSSGSNSGFCIKKIIASLKP